MENYIKKSHEKATKRVYCETLQQSVIAYLKVSRIKSMYYAVVELSINKKFKTFFRNCKKIFFDVRS